MTGEFVANMRDYSPNTPSLFVLFSTVRFLYCLPLILGIVQLFFEGSNMLSNIFVITKNILNKCNEIFQIWLQTIRDRTSIMHNVLF